jgi:phosphoribosylglycinamide formyltransferase 1
MKERLATLISGNGTTMAEIIKACQSGGLPIDIACVISSKVTAGGIKRAFELGIPESDIVVVNPRMYEDSEAFGTALLHELQSRDVTIVTQNGWLHRTPDAVIDAFPERIFNQHPGPVPEFGGDGMYGKRVHAARLAFLKATGRDYWTEAVVHRVTPVYDDGAVVKSEQVAIFPDDTIETLQSRVLPVEHRIQIEFLQEFIEGSLTEVPKRELLVRQGEEKLLSQAKRALLSNY